MRGKLPLLLLLAACGGPVPTADLVARLLDPTGQAVADVLAVRDEIARRPRAEVIAEVVALLRHERPELREQAAATLPLWASTLPPTSPQDFAAATAVTAALLDGLRDPVREVRLCAAIGLSQMHATGEVEAIDAELVPTIAALWDDAIADDLARLAVAAFWLRAKAEPLVPRILAGIEATRDHAEAQISLAQALGATGTADARAGAALSAMLDRADDGIRAAAASALGWLRAGGGEVVAKLRAMLADSSRPRRSRVAAARALADLVTTPAEAAAALADLVAAGDIFDEAGRPGRVAALGALAGKALPLDSAPAVRAELAALSSDDDPDTAAAAVAARLRLLLREGAAPQARAVLAETRAGWQWMLDLVARGIDLHDGSAPRTLLEAWTELAAHPHGGGDPDGELRALLDAACNDRRWRVRAWALPLRARLP